MAKKKKKTSGFVYLWHDRLRNKFYLGCHWGSPSDGYICSNNHMRNAYRKRPQDFKRRILETITTSMEDMFDREYLWLQLIRDEELGVKYYNKQKNHHRHEYSVEYRERLKDAWADPNLRAARIRSMTEAQNRPEVKTKTSENVKKRWQDPAYRENYINKKTGVQLGPHSQDRIEANRLIQLALWATEEHQRKMSEAHLTSEKAIKQSRINIMKTKSREAVAKMTETRRQQAAADAEYRKANADADAAFRAKQSEVARARWGEKATADQLRAVLAGVDSSVIEAFRQTDTRSIPEHIQNIRDGLKPSVDELVKVIGCSKPSFYTWVKREYTPTGDHLKNILGLSYAADASRMKLAA